jgi:hypothetical protein
LDIIAVRLHNHHEVALPLNIEQQLGFPFALLAQQGQRVYRELSRSFERDADA